MAKQATIHFVIRDKIDGSGVEMAMKPSFAELAQRIQNFGPSSLTPAETYAIAAANAVREYGAKADANQGRSHIIIPGLQ